MILLEQKFGSPIATVYMNIKPAIYRGLVIPTVLLDSSKPHLIRVNISSSNWACFVSIDPRHVFSKNKVWCTYCIPPKDFWFLFSLLNAEQMSNWVGVNRESVGETGRFHHVPLQALSDVAAVRRLVRIWWKSLACGSFPKSHCNICNNILMFWFVLVFGNQYGTLIWLTVC